MKKLSLVIFDLADHSPAGRARVVEYLSNRFEISPDIVGARLKNLPFVLRNWLEDNEATEVRTALEGHRCVFDIVENLGNLSDLTPPAPKSPPAEAAQPVSPTDVVEPPAQATVGGAKSVTPTKDEDAAASLFNFELTEPTTSDLAVVAEQLNVLEETSGGIANKLAVERKTIALPASGLDLSFDDIPSASTAIPTTPTAPVTVAPSAASASVIELSFDTPAVEQIAPAPVSAAPKQVNVPSPGPTPVASPIKTTLDFDLSLSEQSNDFQPLVEEILEAPAPPEERFDLKPVTESSAASAPQPPKPTTAPKSNLLTAPPPPKLTATPEDKTPSPSRATNGVTDEVFTEEEEAMLTRAPVPLALKPARLSRRSFTLFHALGLFVIAVAVAFYALMPNAEVATPQLSLSEGSIDKLLQEQEQILNPVAGPPRSISRWVGKIDGNDMITTINLSLDLNQVMLNDTKGYASLEIFGSGKEPPKLTPEEIVARKPFPIWITRFEASLANFTPQEEQSGELRKFEATGEARVYLKQSEKTSRLVSPLRVTGALNLASKKVAGKWELYHGSELPREGTESFSQTVGNSFKFYFFGPITAEPTAPASSSSNSSAASAASIAPKQKSNN